MRQLALDLIAQAPPSLDNFVAGPNAEALETLRALGRGLRPAGRIHLWGDAASGKTHLLRALVGSPLGPDTAPDAFTPQDPAPAVIAIDDCDQLDDTQQLALFRLFNLNAGPDGAVIVTSSRHAPLALDGLRPELRTRLGSGLVLALRSLSDTEREQALRDAAHASGVQCADDVFRYLLTRKARDLRSLLALFGALDRFALERKRPLTAALAREFDALIAPNAQANPIAANPADTLRARKPMNTSTPDQSAGGRRLALFDLDHTLLPIDSDYEWARFLARVGAIDGVEHTRRNDEYLRQYQAGTLNIFEFLEFQLAPLAAHPRAQLDRWHLQYMDEVIRPAIRPSARELVQRHLDQGHLCALVTATNEFVTAPIAAEFGLGHLVATTVESVNGNFTGRPRGTPSFREGKVTRTRQWLESQGATLAGFESSWFYSDSINDLPLLSEVTHPVATNPDDRLERLAAERGWSVLRLFE